MDCIILLSKTICCLLLLICVNSQARDFDPIKNPDQIYFFDDQQNAQPMQWQTADQQQLANQFIAVTPQPVVNQWQADNQRLSINPVVPLKSSEQRKNDVMARERSVIKLDGAAAALTNFGINLMKFVIQHSPGENTVVSPHSIATLLALLQQGSTGATLDQLSTALQLNQQSSAAAFKTYSDNVKTRQSRNILRTANNIFLADGFNLNSNFRASALRDFRSDVTPTNFANGPQAAQDINRWVSQQTDNRIQNLISQDSLGINTQMVLVNAMYFKGLWDLPFRRQATTPGEFLLKSGQVKTAQFMQTRRYFRTGLDRENAAKVITLPFEHAEYSLMLILPNVLSTLEDTLSRLTTSRLEEYLNFPFSETRLELPRFSIKADTDLSVLLQQMGITKLFVNSELSNIGTLPDGRPPLVSEAVHSAAFAIDEEGGSAAAATSFAIVTLSNDEPAVVFKANRPFLAILWDGTANLPLFTAYIEDPTV